MSASLQAPIGILDEHPEWSSRLMAELLARRLPHERIDHSNHAYDPRDREPRYSVIVNRTEAPWTGLPPAFTVIVICG